MHLLTGSRRSAVVQLQRRQEPIAQAPVAPEPGRTSTTDVQRGWQERRLCHGKEETSACLSAAAYDARKFKEVVLSHLAVICNDAAGQPLLSQVIVANEKAILRHDLLRLIRGTPRSCNTKSLVGWRTLWNLIGTDAHQLC